MLRLSIMADEVSESVLNGTKAVEKKGSVLSLILLVPDQAQSTQLIESIMTLVTNHFNQMELPDKSGGQQPKSNEPTNAHTHIHGKIKFVRGATHFAMHVDPEMMRTIEHHEAGTYIVQVELENKFDG